MRSENLFGSADQWVGFLVEKSSTLILFADFKKSRPLVAINLDPQKMC